MNEGLPTINGNVEISPGDVAAGRNPMYKQHITRWVDANPTICPPSLDEHEWREHPVIPGVFQYRYETILHTHMEAHSQRSRHVKPIPEPSRPSSKSRARAHSRASTYDANGGLVSSQ